MGVLLTQKLNLKVVFRRAQTASLAVPPMSGSSTFNTGKNPESLNLQLRHALRADGVIKLSF